MFQWWLSIDTYELFVYKYSNWNNCKDLQLKFKSIYLIFSYYFVVYNIILFSSHSNSLYLFQFSFFFFFTLLIPNALWSSLRTHCWRAYFPLWCKSLDHYFGILLKILDGTINLILHNYKIGMLSGTRVDELIK